MSRGQMPTLDITSELLEKVSSQLDEVFVDGPILCGVIKNKVLLLKAYANVVKGCSITKITKNVPLDAVDDSKQYDKKVAVYFKDPTGVERRFFMSYQLSGKEEKFYWKARVLDLEDKLAKAVKELDQCADDFSRASLDTSLKRVLNSIQTLAQLSEKGEGE